MLSLLPIPILLVGGALVLLGCRGRRLDDHPWCKKCRFDLYQVWPDRKNCPECGADLSRKRAVAAGRRQRRQGIRLTGYGFILLGALGVGLAVRPISHDEWQAMKPVWWLRMEANAGGASADDALKELNSRLMGGALSPKQTEQIVNDVLLAQADKGRPWNVQWGNFIETTRAAGGVASAQWTKYLEQATASHYRLEMRPTIRKGDPIAFKLHESIARTGTVGRFYHRGAVRQIRLGPISVPVDADVNWTLDDWPGSWSNSRSVTEDQWRRVPIGRHEAQIELELVLKGDRFSPFVLLRRTMTLTAPVDVVPEEQSTLEVTIDPSLRSEVERAISVYDVSMNRVADGIYYLSADITVDGSPVGVAFDVFLRSNADNWETQFSPMRADKRTHWDGRFLLGLDDLELTADKLDIVLKPNRNHALKSTDIMVMWGEEVVIKDVPVTLRAPKP